MNEERRSFVNRVKFGAAAVALAGVATTAKGQGKTPFVAARHDQDDWLDAIPGKHRLVFDTVSTDGLREGLLFANNYMIVNRNDYGLQNSDVAVVVVVRHLSTAYGFNDAMWAKYGAQMADSSADSKAKQTPTANPFKASIDGLVKQGIQFAVCSMASRRIAGTIAKANGAETDAVFKELTANVIANGRMVPAGIVAVSRAQERGYTLVSA